MKGYIVPIYTPFNEDGSVDHTQTVIQLNEAVPCIRELATMRGLPGGYSRAPITELSSEDKQILRDACETTGVTPVGQPA